MYPTPLPIPPVRWQVQPVALCLETAIGQQLCHQTIERGTTQGGHAQAAQAVALHAHHIGRTFVFGPGGLQHTLAQVLPVGHAFGAEEGHTGAQEQHRHGHLHGG